MNSPHWPTSAGQWIGCLILLAYGVLGGVNGDMGAVMQALAGIAAIWGIGVKQAHTNALVREVLKDTADIRNDPAMPGSPKG